MKSITFTIQGRLAGANEIKEVNRSHWSQGAKLVKNDLERCKWSIGVQNIGRECRCENAVVVLFAWIEPNAKRDLDNITGGQKVILDALVRCGVIKNDTRRWIKGLFHAFPEPDPENPRIEVTITEEEIYHGK